MLPENRVSTRPAATAPRVGMRPRRRRTGKGERAEVSRPRGDIGSSDTDCAPVGRQFGHPVRPWRFIRSIHFAPHGWPFAPCRSKTSRRLSPTDRFRRYVGTSRLDRWTPPLSAIECMGMWARQALETEGEALTLGVELSASSELIGDVILMWHSAEHRGGEIGYVSIRPSRARGMRPRPRTGSCILRLTISAFTVSWPGLMPTITVRLVLQPGSGCDRRRTSCRTSGLRAGGATSLTSRFWRRVAGDTPRQLPPIHIEPAQLKENSAAGRATFTGPLSEASGITKVLSTHSRGPGSGVCESYRNDQGCWATNRPALWSRAYGSTNVL